ncbi:hypothetical protein KFJ24_16050 [Marinobacter sediminum]|uniref:hypothetical protein n=1 Tax=Marinobacter sediminum TaxID=256323 RepID=UPI00202EA324|nr:hypothetical protein [Marinobacter sediminum]MCM0614000.1 hypothetical protein [Marinobacter sediminum]
MKTLTLISALFAFALGATAHAEGVSIDDMEAGNHPASVHSMAKDNRGSSS